jgi:hypothetical protein
VSPEPIMVPCEGGGHVTPHYLCQMCGRADVVGADGRVSDHSRPDLLAMLDRGAPVAPPEETT